MRKAWLAFFLIGVFLEIFALIVEQQIVFSTLSLAFSYWVYRSCYVQHKTALLTWIIWSYVVLITALVVIGVSLFFLNAANYVRELTPSTVVVGGLSTLYVLTYFYLTIQLRRINRGHH